MKKKIKVYAVSTDKVTRTYISRKAASNALNALGEFNIEAELEEVIKEVEIY